MNPAMENDDAVWAETTDGGLLKQLFGYYPTLHDANIVAIEIDRPSDSITMIFDYNDMVGDDHNQNLAARIRLEWQGIDSFYFPLLQEYVIGLDFERMGEQILTTITTCGNPGRVVSNFVEAVLIQIDPGEPSDDAHFRYR